MDSPPKLPGRVEAAPLPREISLRRTSKFHLLRSSAIGLASILTAFLALLLYANFRLHVTLRVLAREAGVELEYASAYTLAPGQVTLRGVRLTGGTKVVWDVELPQAELRVSAVQLLLGRLHIHSLECAGLAVRGTRFGDFDAGVSTPKREITALGILGSPMSAGRALRIDRATASVERVELGEYRLTGTLRLRASLVELSPQAPALGAVALSMRDAVLYRDDEELLRWLRGNVALSRTSDAVSRDNDLVEHGSPSAPRMSGSLRLAGGDAGELLEFAGVPESVSVMFSNIQGQPFTFEAHVEQRPNAFFLRELRAESGPFRAMGSFRDTATDRAGAFLLTLRGVSAGILVGARDSDLVVGADSAWLVQSERTLGLDQPLPE